MGEVEEVKRQLRARPKEHSKPGLSTGCSLLNLACSGDIRYGYLAGGYYFLVGDSSSGKTWLTMNALAEASINPAFKKHRFIFDNAENGALMDIEKYFGRAVADKLEPPAGTKDSPKCSVVVEDFFHYLDDAFAAKTPFVYILDSQDCLDTRENQKRRKEEKKKSSEDLSGSYGTAKAKAFSNGFPHAIHQLSRSDSILIVISQTRDRIGFGAQFNPKTRSGGNALTFYTTLEVWTSVRGHLRTKVKGNPVEQGIVCRAVVKKNRIQGKVRTVDFPILHESGIDDLGGMVDYLVQWKHWKTTGKEEDKEIDAPEFDFSGRRNDLVRKIEADGEENELKVLTIQTWEEVERLSQVGRKPRYQ